MSGYVKTCKDENKISEFMYFYINYEKKNKAFSTKIEDLKNINLKN